jgi:hypothetical protein
MNDRLEIITRQLTGVFSGEKVKYLVKVADKPGNFADQVISYAAANNADLIMIMTRPNIDIPGFSLSGWDERLMFNEAQVPVMCINPVEISSYYWDWVVQF